MWRCIPLATIYRLTYDSISFGCSYIGGQNSWDYSTASFRAPWGLQMIPAVLLFFGMFFLPESPRWLARHDRWEECHSVLTLVHGKGDANSPIVLTEMQEIQDMCEFERQNKDATYFELFNLKMVNRTLIGLFTQIWSQLTGMNVMSMSAPLFVAPKVNKRQCIISPMSLGWQDTLVIPI